VAEQCVLANTFGSRLKGLLGKKHMSKDEALVLIPCDMIHTLGMRFPIDAAFVDRKGMILKVAQDVETNRIVPRVAGAYAVIEMPAGKTKELGLLPGGILQW
jgi:uncharacterized membrane protein (UPF0127 family)